MDLPNGRVPIRAVHLDFSPTVFGVGRGCKFGNSLFGLFRDIKNRKFLGKSNGEGEP